MQQQQQKPLKYQCFSPIKNYYLLALNLMQFQKKKKKGSWMNGMNIGEKTDMW